MVKKYFVIVVFLSVYWGCAGLLLASSSSQEGIFSAKHVKAAFDRDFVGGRCSSIHGVSFPIVVAEPAIRIERTLTPAEMVLSELIASQEESQKAIKAVPFHSFFIKTIEAQVLIHKKSDNKKRLLKQSRKFLIDPTLHQGAIYEEGYHQGLSDGKDLIEKYADISLKDELHLLHKDLYDKAFQAAKSIHEVAENELQKKYQSDLESKQLIYNSEKYENYKKGLRCGLLIGTITAGAAISAGLYFYYHHKEI